MTRMIQQAVRCEPYNQCCMLLWSPARSHRRMRSAPDCSLAAWVSATQCFTTSMRTAIGAFSNASHAVQHVQADAPKLPDGPEPTVVSHMDYVPLDQSAPCKNPSRSWQVGLHFTILGPYPGAGAVADNVLQAGLRAESMPSCLHWLQLGAVVMQDALSALQSSNWVDACRALSVVQQLAAHHQPELQQHL
jgi:hypothetical protein